jgi:hypothetical protein
MIGSIQLGMMMPAHKLHYRTEFQGLPVSVENRKNSRRYWIDDNTGETGSTKMKYPYGYVRGTLGTDGDEVDVYVGPNKKSDKVFVVTQMKKPKFKEVDEQKVMLGFDSAKEAKAAFLAHYDDRRFFGSMKEINVAEFQVKLKKQHGKLIKAKMAEGGFTTEEASRVASLMDLDLDKQKFTLDEWTMGLNEELEHKDVTQAGAVMTGKITLAHLQENPQYYTKLKKMEKSLKDSSTTAIMTEDNISMLLLSPSDLQKAFKPVALKPGSEESRMNMDKARLNDTQTPDDQEEDQEKGFGKSTRDKAIEVLQKAQAALDPEEMDLKKKFKSKKQVKYMHAAAGRGEVPKKVLKEFKEKTPKKAYAKLPEDATPDDDKKVKKSNNIEHIDLNKALRAIAAAGLSKRARLDAAYQLGQAVGRTRPIKSSEPVNVHLNVGTTRARSEHEPPVVPIRRVETPQAQHSVGAHMESCAVHGYVHKSDSRCPLCAQANISEASPLWSR